jgi:hypothetical protein
MIKLNGFPTTDLNTGRIDRTQYFILTIYSYKSYKIFNILIY